MSDRFDVDLEDVIFEDEGVAGEDEGEDEGEEKNWSAPARIRSNLDPKISKRDWRAR